MFSSEGVMEDIPLDLIIIPVPRHRLQTDEKKESEKRVTESQLRHECLTERLEMN